MSFVNAQGNLVEGDSDLANAIKADPTGVVCAWCGGPNTFADDCGFWYCTPEGDITGATCEGCYNGEVGRKHIARYGLGER